MNASNEAAQKWIPRKLSAYKPEGREFFSIGRGQNMLLVTSGPWTDWICYEHPDGQWVTLRKATESDRLAINDAMGR